MARKINANKCVECGCCEDCCPAEAISSGTPYRIDANKCVDCGACEASCPAGAIDSVALKTKGAIFADAAVSPVPDHSDGNMKVAIVGVEGSGKTVMLSCLGERYSVPDANGVFLKPCNFQTWSYTSSIVARLRNGQWPAATTEDSMVDLSWTLSRKRGDNEVPIDLSQIMFLDFPGEVYRAAYGIKHDAVDGRLVDGVRRLRKYITHADALIVLINLRDVIAFGMQEKRVQEAVWITNSILDTVFAGQVQSGTKKQVAIVLSQADSYAATIQACGGAKKTLEKYLPNVAASYGWVDVFSVMAIDKTRVDNDGSVVPDGAFVTDGLMPLMDWIEKVEFTAKPKIPPELADFRFDGKSLNYDIKRFEMESGWALNGGRLLKNSLELGLIAETEYNLVVDRALKGDTRKMRKLVVSEIRRIYGRRFLLEEDGCFVVPVPKKQCTGLFSKITRILKGLA